MILQPRNFYWKKKQKLRKIIYSKKKTNTRYGDSAVTILKPLKLTGLKIFRLKLFLKRATKKPDKTHRKVWFYAFPHLPLTKKPLGLRMGKGKGKLSSWGIKLPGGTTLLEFKNLRFGRSIFFSKQVSFKLSVPCNFFHNYKKKFNLPMFYKKKINLKSSW